MMCPWKCLLRVGPKELKILVGDSSSAEVLKAWMGLGAKHPRALLTLLEGLALYNGHALTAVVSAAGSCAGWWTESVFGDGLWPTESPLVQFVGAFRDNRGRLRGLGDFRSLGRFESQGGTP
jgi:hypothetical protein